MANPKKGKYFEEPMRTQGKKAPKARENAGKRGKTRENAGKRGKTRATKSSMVLVLHLIGWESGVSFLD